MSGNSDPKVTGRTKRFREQMTLLQHTLRARESANRVVESLDHIANPAIDAASFKRIVLDRFADAKTDADRENVRSLVASGVTGNIITDLEAEELLEKMRD